MTSSDRRWTEIVDARRDKTSLPDHATEWNGPWSLYRECFQGSVDGLRVVAHLGQSLDGKIAAANGQSRYVTGPDDLLHMHRLRALADAVVVGAGTVAHDDPQLTVRLCQGRSPVRVVIDPERRLNTNHRVFHDVEARTILLTGPKLVGDGRHGIASVFGIQINEDGNYCPRSVQQVLATQGLHHLLIEGGGATVARFWQAGCLDRLDLCVAPVIIGKGREALPLPSVQSMSEAERFKPRVIPLGPDRLYVLRRHRQPLASRQEQKVAMAHLHRDGHSVPLAEP